MTKTFYHATPFENLESIMDQGILRGCDGVVYVTLQPEEAARFIAIRGVRKILVCKINIEEELIEESFDHSFGFFKCRAFSYSEDVLPNEITEFLEFEVKSN